MSRRFPLVSAMPAPHRVRAPLRRLPPLLGGLLALSAQAQEAPRPAAPAASAPTQQVEVTATRPSDTEERRRSTAAKIVVGRDEIERFGDASLGELLKRLPGVTLDGRAGRGGNIRMRGLGGGYTQILLDGERVQGGMSLDAIDPEQVERIEILRAPTAETGARAIAGTINIITREGYRKRLNDVKLGLGGENGHGGGNASWSRDDRVDERLNYQFSISVWGFERRESSRTDTESDTESLRETSPVSYDRWGFWSTGRLQWRLDGGDQFMLMPTAHATQGSARRDSVLSVLRDDDGQAPDYARSHTPSDDEYQLGRLNFMWRQGLGEAGRLEWRGGVAGSRSLSHSWRRELAADGSLLRTQDESALSTERNGHLHLKHTLVLDGGHEWVSGAELDAARRQSSRESLVDGVSQLGSLGTDLEARTLRVAAFTQDEWSLTPNWAAHAGLRWEGLRTRGSDLDGAPVENLSSVWTPLLHAVWKPDPKGRDQVRISLTRSYRSPQLAQLLALPTVSTRYPLPGSNTPTSPDRAGNPALSPELATGLDLALERYLAGGGMLSANLFHRRIDGLMRTLTTLETVPWSTVPRWVARPQNLGQAQTTGLELELRGRLAEFLDEAPAVELRANASVFSSRVDSVAGPDNRLDQQPDGTLNLGADWRIGGTPLTLGGNLNLTPGYTTRLSETQWLVQPRKRVLDAYLLWPLSPHARLRLSASNLLPETARSQSLVGDETATSFNPSLVSARVQLELKL